MIISTRSRIRDRRSRLRGFTLTELLIAAGLSAGVLAGVLSSFLFLARSGANIKNYSEMEFQSRTALELFAEDTRQASEVSWASATSVTLTVNATPITYTFASGQFTRTAGSSTRTLLSGVTDFDFVAYTIRGIEITDFSTAAARTVANNTTKQIQISLSAARNSATASTATNIVLSARYVLRNKRVTA